MGKKWTADNLIGKKFGRLFVKSRVKNTGCGHSTWLCVCECGQEKLATGTQMKRGRTQSCGCLTSESKKERLRLRPYEALYNILIRASKRYKHPCELSYEDFVKFTKIKHCHYCKKEVNWSEYTKADKKGGYNLDRVDNAKWYTRDNCVVCCSRCNKSKGDRFTYDEWKSIGRLIQTWEK